MKLISPDSSVNEQEELLKNGFKLEPKRQLVIPELDDQILLQFLGVNKESKCRDSKGNSLSYFEYAKTILLPMIQRYLRMIRVTDAFENSQERDSFYENHPEFNKFMDENNQLRPTNIAMVINSMMTIILMIDSEGNIPINLAQRDISLEKITSETTDDKLKKLFPDRRDSDSDDVDRYHYLGDDDVSMDDLKRTIYNIALELRGELLGEGNESVYETSFSNREKLVFVKKLERVAMKFLHLFSSYDFLSQDDEVVSAEIKKYLKEDGFEFKGSVGDLFGLSLPNIDLKAKAKYFKDNDVSSLVKLMNELRKILDSQLIADYFEHQRDRYEWGAGLPNAVYDYLKKFNVYKTAKLIGFLGYVVKMSLFISDEDRAEIIFNLSQSLNNRLKERTIKEQLDHDQGINYGYDYEELNRFIKQFLEDIISNIERIFST